MPKRATPLLTSNGEINMYRDILTPPEKVKVKHKCKACGMIRMRAADCQITGKKAGSGFEHLCKYRGCRGALVLVKNPLLGD
jgi:hypothetical protein